MIIVDGIVTTMAKQERQLAGKTLPVRPLASWVSTVSTEMCFDGCILMPLHSLLVATQ